MTIRCPLCEEYISSDVKLKDGQSVICPMCEKKFSFFYNSLSEKEDEQLPIIISSGEEFENFLCEKINELQYVNCQKTKATGDQGVDLIVEVGEKKIAVQCKLYSYPVGNDAVQEVFSGKSFYNCDMAIVVTNSSYTRSAFELAKQLGVKLLHHNELINFIEKESGSIEKQSEKEFAAADSFFVEKGDELAVLEIKLLRNFKDIGLIKIDEIKKLLAMQKEVGRDLCNETIVVIIEAIAHQLRGFPVAAQNGKFGDALKKAIDLHREQVYGNVSYGGAEGIDANNYVDSWEAIESLVRIVECIMRERPYGGLKPAISIDSFISTFKISIPVISDFELEKKVHTVKKDFVGHGVDLPRILFGKSFVEDFKVRSLNKRQSFWIKKIEVLTAEEFEVLKKVASLPKGYLFRPMGEAEKKCIIQIIQFRLC